MAMIHVNRGATSLGAFSEEDVREGLRTGRFVSTDLGWHEGMPSWKSLSQFPEFGAPTPPPSQAGAGPIVAPSAAGSTSESFVPRSGLPWEHRQERGFFNAFIETLTMVLTKPDVAFKTMRVDGGIGEPLIYGLIGGCAGAVVSVLLSIGLQSMGLFASQREAFGRLAAMGIGSVLFVVLMPVLVTIGLFIGALIAHVCLWIFGGVNRPFETTFRVISFSQGSVGPLQMIPVCGSFIALVWGLVVECIGLARAHETDMWRAVLAILLPFILCCGCFFALFAFGLTGVWSASQR